MAAAAHLNAERLPYISAATGPVQNAAPQSRLSCNSALSPDPSYIASNVFALVIFDVTQLSYRASIVPDDIFGRVTSSIRLLTVGALSLGAAVAGSMLQLIGPINTVYSFSAYLLVLALLTTQNRDIRQAGSLSGAEATLENEAAS